MRRFWILASILVLAVLAGCGGSDDSTSSPRTVSDPRSTASTPNLRHEEKQQGGEGERRRHANAEERGKKAPKPSEPKEARDRHGKQAPPAHVSKEAKELREAARRYAERASEPLSDEELRAIAERAVESAEQLPPPGQSAADSIRAAEEVISGAAR